MIAAVIARIVMFCVRHAWPVIGAFVLIAAASAFYLVAHFAITTDSTKLLSQNLPWRQQEIALNKAFPQRTDTLIVVLDANTPERAEAGAAALAARLTPMSDMFVSVRRPDADPFFVRNGILFQPLETIKTQTAGLIRAQAFLGALAADPSLRGLMESSLDGADRRSHRQGEARRPGPPDVGHRRPRSSGWRPARIRLFPGGRSCRTSRPSRPSFASSSSSSRS